MSQAMWTCTRVQELLNDCNPKGLHIFSSKTSACKLEEERNIINPMLFVIQFMYFYYSNVIERYNFCFFFFLSIRHIGMQTIIVSLLLTQKNNNKIRLLHTIAFQKKSRGKLTTNVVSRESILHKHYEKT